MDFWLLHFIIYILDIPLWGIFLRCLRTRRYGGADDNRPASQRYEWAIDYTFKDLEVNSR